MAAPAARRRAPHPHAFARNGGYVRTATVTYDGTNLWVVSGVKDYVVLKTTDSEFWGYLEDKYTTLSLTTDRVMATSVTGQWWHTDTAADWNKSLRQRRRHHEQRVCRHHSLALQQTMFAMGEAMIADSRRFGEVRFSLPNKHHFVIDLSPYGLENPNEVFHADDRPYGFIDGTIQNDLHKDATPAIRPSIPVRAGNPPDGHHEHSGRILRGSRASNCCPTGSIPSTRCSNRTDGASTAFST